MKKANNISFMGLRGALGVEIVGNDFKVEIYQYMKGLIQIFKYDMVGNEYHQTDSFETKELKANNILKSVEERFNLSFQPRIEYRENALSLIERIL